jgi:drug/metabolite transporter (DMT)-like permease
MNKAISSSWRGPLLVVAAAVLWSTAGLGIKHLPYFPLLTAGWRSFFALLVLVAFGGLREARFSILRQPAMLATVCSYALTLCLFVSATRLTTAANAILLQYTSPIWVLLLSTPVLKEKPRVRDFILAAGCLAGLAFFFLDKLTKEGLLGMILAILAGASASCLLVGLRYHGLRGGGTSLTAVLFGNLLCIVICLPWMWTQTSTIRAEHWAILAGLGLFQLGLSYLCFTAALRRVTAFRATIVGLIEPLLNPIWVGLAGGEVPGPGALAGGGVILGCMILDAVFSGRRTGAQRRS